MSAKPVGSPGCFGAEFSAAAVECTGGPDAAYTHPRTGAQVRDKCGWFSACASSTAANRAPRPLIPAQNLFRQGPPKPAQSHPMVAARQPMFQPQQTFMHPQQFIPQQQHHMHMEPPQYPYMVAPYIAQQGPQMVPIMVQQPGSQMQHYLTVPEPIDLNESPWKRLFREILRSMGKSAGHTSAAFFDHNPINPHKRPDDESS